MKKSKIKTKKSLGQNWLKSERAVAAIIEAAHLTHEDTVLEIGPGEGVLTDRLLIHTKKVIAVEKDVRLIKHLQERLSPAIKLGKLDLYEGDILETTFSSIGLGGDYKLVANIPYYITGEIIRKFLEASHQPRTIVLLVQKEVGERIIAKDKKESILSISVKAYGTPKYVQTVPRGAFAPAPKVDSAIIAIENISKHHFTPRSGVSEAKFFEVVKRGFGQKRKQLKNNLGLTARDLTTCGVGEKARAEELSVTQWLCLAKHSH